MSNVTRGCASWYAPKRLEVAKLKNINKANLLNFCLVLFRLAEFFGSLYCKRALRLSRHPAGSSIQGGCLSLRGTQAAKKAKSNCSKAVAIARYLIFVKCLFKFSTNFINKRSHICANKLTIF